MNEHEGHDQDCAHETECVCGEIVRDPEHHTCIVLGQPHWTPEPIARLRAALQQGDQP